MAETPLPLTARLHGGPAPGVSAELAALGISPGDVLDLSVNVNPYGPAPAVVAAARAAALERYPDPSARAVREALAARWRRAPEEVLFGHGAAELLWDVARYLARGGARTLLVEPAFSELRVALAASGGEVCAWRADPERGLAVDLGAVGEELGRSGAGAVALAAPSSPAGASVPAYAIAALARAYPQVLVVLDESFLSLSDRWTDAELPLPANVIRLRSLTKEHAIPGLRAGYLLAAAHVVAALEAARPTWATSAPAQAAALAAVREDDFVARSRARLRVDRDATAEALARLGLAPIPSTAPYVTFGAPDAAALRGRLLARGIVVRDCASFGLPSHLRVAARPEAERARWLGVLAEVVR